MTDENLPEDMVEIAKSPEELVRQLQESPIDWKANIDAFATAHLDLELVFHRNGDPVLRRSDGHVARVGYSSEKFLFAYTDRGMQSLDAADNLQVDAADLVARIVRFSNGE